MIEKENKMIKIRPIQQISKKWLRNTLTANPERISGIIEAYLSGKQNFNWVAGLLKNEPSNLSWEILNSIQDGDSIRRRHLLRWLNSLT